MKIADDFELHPRLLDDLNRVQAELLASGKLPSRKELERYYRTFRERFGPDALLDLDGEALLSRMHESGRDGMIYWLEFKDDDEFPWIFGSVSGGSALKYGFYRRQETGEWTTGSPRAQRTISTDEAIALASRNRDQLLIASELLVQIPAGASSEAYVQLQSELAQFAPDIQNSVWGHKYLSLIHPEKLDDYHTVSHQRFHLAKLLQQPSPVEGRYVNAPCFVSLGRALQWPLNHVTTVLNRRNGSPASLLEGRHTRWRHWNEPLGPHAAGIDRGCRVVETGRPVGGAGQRWFPRTIQSSPRRIVSGGTQRDGAFGSETYELLQANGGW